MKELKPMLFTCMKEYSRGQFVKDLIAGVIVAIIALPLSIALALASGVGPEQGLYTAIIAGFIISFLGGSRVQIAGPTAAFATIVAGIVARSGMDGLMLATIMAGILLVVMGLLKMGALIKFIPYTITTGFTAGIAVTILIGQLKDFFGVTYLAGEAPVETMEKLGAFIRGLGSVNIQALIVGAVCLAILLLWPKKLARIPASLVSVLVGIGMVKLFDMQVNTIGQLYTISSALPTLQLPSLSLASIQALFPDALTIAVLAAIESLLSCVVADDMTGGRHRSNMELVAQGIGNIGSALFGGIPATGAIARTAANVKNGGRTPIAGIVHAIVLVLILVVLMPYAALIPMPAIAAILFSVAYNMCQWRPFVALVRTSPKSDVLVLVVTFLLTVVFDLVIAIAVGMLLACALFLKRMRQETQITGWKYAEASDDPDAQRLRHVSRHIRVFEISGPLFFGAADRLSEVDVEAGTRCLILRMRSVPALDASAMRALEQLFDRCAAEGVTLILSHVNEQPMRTLEKGGLTDKLGRENVCINIDEALARAETLAEPVEAK